MSPKYTHSFCIYNYPKTIVYLNEYLLLIKFQIKKGLVLRKIYKNKIILFHNQLLIVE